LERLSPTVAEDHSLVRSLNDKQTYYIVWHNESAEDLPEIRPVVISIPLFWHGVLRVLITWIGLGVTSKEVVVFKFVFCSEIAQM